VRRGKEEQRRREEQERNMRERSEERKSKGKGEIRARGGPSKMISSRAQARLSAGLMVGNGIKKESIREASGRLGKLGL